MNKKAQYKNQLQKVLRLGQASNSDRLMVKWQYIGIIKDKLLLILWNHFNSWRSIFVGNPNFPGLWGRNFDGSKFYFVDKYWANSCTIFLSNYADFLTILSYMWHYLWINPRTYIRGDVHSWAGVTKNNDSTVFWLTTKAVKSIQTSSMY